jgi:hypothetical protein
MKGGLRGNEKEDRGKEHRRRDLEPESAAGPLPWRSAPPSTAPRGGDGRKKCPFMEGMAGGPARNGMTLVHEQLRWDALIFKGKDGLRPVWRS